MLQQQKHATQALQSQLDNLAVRMTIALLRRVVSDPLASAETLHRVACAVCDCLSRLPQTDQIATAYRWVHRALAYDDDAPLASWCLEQALHALMC
ncbi:MAG: hypothetical protein SLRJCFUN_001569 [Candidatus Fervidibacter sp.]|jgi:hypothetical protein